MRLVASRRHVKGLFPLVVASTVACGGSTEPDPKPTEQIATVVIGNAPTSPLLVGGTVQLSATAVNASGGTVSGANFTWQTSDQTKASVSTGGLVTALDAGAVDITATAGGKSGKVAIDIRAGGSIGPAGGVLTVLNGAVRLEVPAGALGQTVNFLIRPAVDPAQNPRIVPGTIYELGPEGTRFGLVQMTLRYDPAKIPAGLVEGSLQLYALTAGVWTQIPGSEVALATKEVRGIITSAGIYAVASTPVARIVIGGQSVDGALYGSQTAQLTATLFDAFDTELTGRPVTWTSSDNGKATVVNGLVTAVAVGNATITASADGKSAQTTIAVLARPTADWSQAVEWATHQGDSTHRGFFAATLDPVVFTERWVKTLTTDPLNPVAVASGAAVVTPRSHFGTQKAWSLNVTNGQQRWVADYGQIHGVHPPVISNGRVYFTTSGHGDSYLYALDAQTGTQQFRTQYGNQWSRWLAPVIVGSRVYMAGGSYGGMYAMDAITGAQLWFTDTGQFDGWSPAVRGGLAYAYRPGSPGSLMALDAATGTMSYEISDPDANFFVYDLEMSPVLGGPSEAYITHRNRLLSFDLATKTIRWSKTSEFAGNVAVANGVLYIVNGGQLEARLPADGALSWTWKPASQQLQANVVVTNNLVFVKGESRTYAVDIVARREVWSYPATGELTPSAEGYLFIAGNDGKVRAIGIR